MLQFSKKLQFIYLRIMKTIKEDIKTHSNWLVQAFQEDGLTLDYSIGSLLTIDRFFQKHAKDGHPIKGGRLSKNFGSVIFAISSYVGEALIKNAPKAVWEADDNDPQVEINMAVKFVDGTICWPSQRVMKRLQNGLEDGIYPYGHQLTQEYTQEAFDESFWRIQQEVKTLQPKKSFWRFW